MGPGPSPSGHPGMTVLEKEFADGNDGRVSHPRSPPARLGGLNDPAILKSSIPGCQTIEKLSDTEFTAKVLAQVGPVKANFAGKVTLADLNPPQSYTIAGEGTGGVAGFAKGSAKVNLDEDGGATACITSSRRMSAAS